MSTIACTCTHAFQDATYGKGRRAWTPKTEGPARHPIRARCTVCSAESSLPSDAKGLSKLKKFLAKK